MMARGGGVLAAAWLALVSLAAPTMAEEPALASPWIKEHSTSVRMVGGSGTLGDGKTQVFAGIEIQLDEGWKTYWRNPGSSGVPPRVDWQGSENLAEATVLFPAPQRFLDKEGDTVGYKKSVVLPVVVRPLDPAKPVVLKLSLEYGVCREVCIPVQPSLALSLPASAAVKPAGGGLSMALARIPRDQSKRRPADPQAKSIKVALAGAKPSIEIEAEFPASVAGADAFLEAPDGLWIPLAKLVPGGTGNVRRFEVDLTDGADIADLKGRSIRLTLVSEAGQSETTFKLE